MTFIDCILLTLINTVACLAFPKMLSVILAAKTKKTAPTPTPMTSIEPSSEIPSFS